MGNSQGKPVEFDGEGEFLDSCRNLLAILVANTEIVAPQ